MENSAGSNRFAAQLIFFGFGVLSWWTTGAGLAVLTGMPIFAYAISVLIQWLLALTALKLFSEYGLKRGIALILYLLTATVSIAFSISFWFSLFSAQAYADHLFNQQYETVYKNAKQLQYTYKQENTALNILAKQAAVIARKEIKSGGTCRRGSKSGLGPLSSKRIYQAETFLSLSQAFGAPINAIDAQMNAIRKIKHSTLPVKERLNKLQEAASNLNVQIKQSQIYKTELMHHLKWEKNGYPAGSHSGKYDFSGSQYACSEISIIAPIKRLLIAWPEQIPAIQVFDPNDKKMVITKIAMSLSTLIVPLTHSEEEGRQSVFDRQYILSFFMGFLVDILILFGAFLLNPGKRKKRNKDGALTLDDLWDFYTDAVGICKVYPCDLVPDQGRKSPKILLNISEAADFLKQLLDRTSLLINSEYYFLIPVDSNQKPLQINGSQARMKLSLLDAFKEIFTSKKLVGLHLGASKLTAFRGHGIQAIKKLLDLKDGELANDAKFSVFSLNAKISTLIRDYAADQRCFDEMPNWFLQQDDGTLDLEKWAHMGKSIQRKHFADYVLDHAVPHKQQGEKEILGHTCSAEIEEYHLKLRRGHGGKETFEDEIASWLLDDDDGLGKKVEKQVINLGFTSLPYPFFHAFVLSSEGWEIIQKFAETTGGDGADAE